jgi:hypothetical protein
MISDDLDFIFIAFYFVEVYVVAEMWIACGVGLITNFIIRHPKFLHSQGIGIYTLYRFL